MLGVKNFMSGKKANLSAGWMFAGAVALLMNGAMVDPDTGEIILSSSDGQLAALLTSLSVGLATLRASIAKIAQNLPSSVPMILGGLVLGFYAVGCSTLGNIDPNTGETFAAGIQDEIVNLVPLFGPVLSTIIPIATGGILNIATILGQMMNSNSSNPTPGPVS